MQRSKAAQIADLYRDLADVRRDLADLDHWDGDWEAHEVEQWRLIQRRQQICNQIHALQS